MLYTRSSPGKNTLTVRGRRRARCADCSHTWVRLLYADRTPVVPMPSSLGRVLIPNLELLQYTLPDLALSPFVRAIRKKSTSRYETKNIVRCARCRSFDPQMTQDRTIFGCVLSPASALAGLHQATGPSLILASIGGDPSLADFDPGFQKEGRLPASFQYEFRAYAPIGTVPSAALSRRG
jgi:hypothetical protein